MDHPDVNFVICHIGNPWIRDCMEVLYKNANVFTDFSGLVLGDFDDRFESYMRKQVQEMLLYGVQPEKCLFGTDWPIASMESYLDFMGEMKIPPAGPAHDHVRERDPPFQAADRVPAIGGLPFGKL